MLQSAWQTGEYFRISSILLKSLVSLTIAAAIPVNFCIGRPLYIGWYASAVNGIIFTIDIRHARRCKVNTLPSLSPTPAPSYYVPWSRCNWQESVLEMLSPLKRRWIWRWVELLVTLWHCDIETLWHCHRDKGNGKNEQMMAVWQQRHNVRCTF